MGAVTLGGILRAEHDILHDALTEWCGTVSGKESEDIQYVCGVHDMAHKLIELLEGKDGNSDNG